MPIYLSEEFDDELLSEDLVLTEGTKYDKKAAKVIFFTAMGALSYCLLLLVMGVEAAIGEGWLLIAVSVLLWDVLFMRLDYMLGAPVRKR